MVTAQRVHVPCIIIIKYMYYYNLHVIYIKRIKQTISISYHGNCTACTCTMHGNDLCIRTLLHSSVREWWWGPQRGENSILRWNRGTVTWKSKKKKTLEKNLILNPKLSIQLIDLFTGKNTTLFHHFVRTQFDRQIICLNNHR